mgnify:CR=1 FL=1
MQRIPHISEPLFDAGTQKVNDNWFRFFDDLTTVVNAMRLQSYAVANLPSAVTIGAGARALVTDANATTFASVVAGGGANVVPVYSDGTDWRIG